MLLVNYSDNRHPEIYGTLNLITTAAMSGPCWGGVADRFGNFAGIFQVYARWQWCWWSSRAFMRPPAVTQYTLDILRDLYS